MPAAKAEGIAVIRDRERLLEHLRQLHEAIQRAVVAAMERAAPGALAAVVADTDDSDTIYALDRISEDYLVDWFAREVAPERGSCWWPRGCLIVAMGRGCWRCRVASAPMRRKCAF